MPRVQKLTPNLIVSDIERSIAFYRDVLGFAVETTVPDAAPFVFAILRNGPVEIFLNAMEPAIAEYPSLARTPLGGSLTLFMEVEQVRSAHEVLARKAPVVMPLEKKWYGVTEFAISDPDGYVITLAEREA
jgi:lactoylglutathione lyase